MNSSRLTNAETSELKSLTSLRGLAAMAVVLQHFSATAQQYCRTTIPSLVPHGYIAVDFFFVLSGFIMSYTYLESFLSRKLGAYGPFLVKRVARIVPLNIVVLVGIACAGLVSSLTLSENIFFATHNFIFDFLANFFMVQGIGIGNNLNGPSWSISTEFVVYFFFPLFVAVMFSRRALAYVALVIAVIGLCALATTQHRLGLGFEGPPGSLIRCFTEFALGMASYRMFMHKRLAAFLRNDAVTIVLTVLAGLSLALRYDLPAALLFPFIVTAYAGNTGMAARIMQIRFFYFLGVISYSLYLIHNPFRPLELYFIREMVPQSLGKLEALTFALVGSISIIPFAWLAYVTIERPGRELARALFTR